MAWSATNSEGYPAPVALAADVVVLRVGEAGVLEVLVVERPEGLPGLPGGFVGPREDPRETATRKLREKAGVEHPYLEQLATFAAPDRDPRGWIPSVAHLALGPPGTRAPDPAARWIPARGDAPLAFDHRDMVRAGLDRLEGKLWWSNVAVGLLPETFSLSEARAAYEAVADRTYDPATFARDLKATGLVEPTGERRAEGRGRPGALYRFRTREPAWGAGRRKRVAALPAG